MTIHAIEPRPRPVYRKDWQEAADLQPAPTLEQSIKAWRALLQMRKQEQVDVLPENNAAMRTASNGAAGAAQ